MRPREIMMVDHRTGTVEPYGKKRDRNDEDQRRQHPPTA